MTEPKTKVIFRYFRGEVVAIFPEIAGTYDSGTCSCYASMGQHSACNPYLVIDDSKLATPEQYADLKQELENLGYNLEIIKRHRYSHYETRKAELSLTA